MGFDIVGVAPVGVKGKYFRNNCWAWRPLWDFVFWCGHVVLTREDYQRGHFNDFHKIDAEKSAALHKIITGCIERGIAQRYIDTRNNVLSSLPVVPCKLCAGTGIRSDAIAKINGFSVCNGCQGAGKRKDDATHYPLTLQNIQDFADFLSECGGFEIG